MRPKFGKSSNMTGGFYFALLMSFQLEAKLTDGALVAAMNKEFKTNTYDEARIRQYRRQYNVGKLNQRTPKPETPVPRYDIHGNIDKPKFGPKT